jgi:rhamnogalacturonyl hydrolase YesR
MDDIMKPNFIFLIGIFLFCTGFIPADPDKSDNHHILARKSDRSTVWQTSLLDFPPHAAPELVCELVIDNLFTRDYMMRADGSGIHYAELLTAEGAITFATVTQDRGLYSRLEKRYSCFMEPGCSLIKPNGGGNQVALVVLAMYLQNKEQKYLDRVYSLLQQQRDKWNNADPNTGLPSNMRYWSDDVYFFSAIESRIFSINGEKNSINRVAKKMEAYLDTLQLPNGLIKHTKNVPFVWGRGDGWIAAGLADALQAMPLDHPERQTLMESYLHLMKGLLPYQSSGGLWRQLIDDPKAWEETSGSAMFTYAMVTGIRLGWLNTEIYGPVVKKAWLALVERLNSDGELEDVCIGTNEKQSAQEYLDRPGRAGDHHGQGPLLWTANALLLYKQSRE